MARVSMTNPVVKTAAARLEPATSGGVPRPRSTTPRRAAGVRDLDRVVHERLRLGILAALSVNDGLTFNELKDTLDSTDGNLSDHTRKLELAGYITIAKGYEGRKPQTVYSLTRRGRQALRGYIETMQAVLEEAGRSLA
jgi:DNA-binding MarR family transcriptional regulator